MTNFVKRAEAELEGYIQTIELKFKGGRLYQKYIAGHPGGTPTHHWVEVDDHDEEEAAAKAKADAQVEEDQAAANAKAAADAEVPVLTEAFDDEGTTVKEVSPPQGQVQAQPLTPRTANTPKPSPAPKPAA